MYESGLQWWHLAAALGLAVVLVEFGWTWFVAAIVVAAIAENS